MAKKRRDDTSLSSLLGRKREINIDEIEQATEKVHKVSKLPEKKVEPKIKEVTEAPVQPKENPIEKLEKKKEAKVSRKPKSTPKAPAPSEEEVVRASIATPYELYLKAKRVQRKEGFRSLGAFYLHCVEDYLKKPIQSIGSYEAPDFEDSIDVSVSPQLELWMQIKFNQRKLGFRNMAGFYVFCLSRYLKKA